MRPFSRDKFVYSLFNREKAAAIQRLPIQLFSLITIGFTQFLIKSFRASYIMKDYYPLFVLSYSCIFPIVSYICLQTSLTHSPINTLQPIDNLLPWILTLVSLAK